MGTRWNDVFNPNTRQAGKYSTKQNENVTTLQSYIKARQKLKFGTLLNKIQSIELMILSITLHFELHVNLIIMLSLGSISVL